MTKKMMQSAEAAVAEMKATMKSINFNLTMEALWDGQSYNFKPLVPQSHDRVHFEEGCTNFMIANELDESQRLVISFTAYNQATGITCYHTFDYYNPTKMSYVAYFLLKFDMYCLQNAIDDGSYFTCVNIYLTNL